MIAWSIEYGRWLLTDFLSPDPVSWLRTHVVHAWHLLGWIIGFGVLRHIIRARRAPQKALFTMAKRFGEENAAAVQRLEQAGFPSTRPEAARLQATFPELKKFLEKNAHVIH